MNVATAPALKYNFETGIYRPPSEGGSYSLLIRVSRNCPWNRCEFCMMYKGEKFELRAPEEVKADIDSIAAICNRLKSISRKLGYNGEMNRNVAIALLEETPELNTSHGFVMVYDWLSAGGENGVPAGRKQLDSAYAKACGYIEAFTENISLPKQGHFLRKIQNTGSEEA